MIAKAQRQGIRSISSVQHQVAALRKQRRDSLQAQGRDSIRQAAQPRDDPHCLTTAGPLAAQIGYRVYPCHGGNAIGSKQHAVVGAPCEWL